MKSHNVSIEMEPPFDCDYCGFEMDSYNALCEHQQLHLNRPEFECVFCDYKPNDKQRLRQHTRKHVSVKMFRFHSNPRAQCTSTTCICTFAFARTNLFVFECREKSLTNSTYAIYAEEFSRDSVYLRCT